MSERERLEQLRRLFADLPADGVTLPIGDDAAIIDVGGVGLVSSVDTSVEGTHFRRAWLSLHALGYRASMAAASDLAAMGAAPRGLLSSLILPADMSDAQLLELATGQRDACAELGMPLLGGNLAGGERLSITSTVLGQCAADGGLRRGGAKPGDVVLVSGELGMAAAGLRALLEELKHDALVPALQAWRRPRARVAEGLRAASLATGGIDLSDGLSLDASHVAVESGVSVMLDRHALLTPALQGAAEALDADALELALHGGEDYALLVTATQPIEGFLRIGRIEEGQGVWIDGAELEPKGYDHFA
jgi:thiamine-monophosphate kinase